MNRLKKFLPENPIAEETVALLQMMVREDTTNPPGNEIGLASKLQAYIEKEKFPNVTTKIIESEPGRGSLIVNIAGSEADKFPSFGFQSHLDVVPAEGEWKYPPFSAERVAVGETEYIWGRGTFDMKYIGAAYLMAALTALREGFKPKGNLKLLFVADEERSGVLGMGYLVREHWDDVKTDFAINEGGGPKIPLKNDFIIQVAEKGTFRTRLRTRGQSGHGSTPPPYDKFALLKMTEALEALKRYKLELILTDEYNNMRKAISLPGVVKWLLGRRRLLRGLVKLAGKFVKGFNVAQVILPFVQEIISPTIFRAGVKVNSISPDAVAELDIRTLPGHDRAFVDDMIKKAIGKKRFKRLGIEIEEIGNIMATTSPIDTPFYDLINGILQKMWTGANLVPMMGTGGTDMKFFRNFYPGKYAVCYGFNPMVKDPDMTYGEMLGLAHAPDERVSVANLMLATDFAYRLMQRV